MTKVQRFVYFMKPIGMDGPIKIGCSNVPATRLETLACWSPFELEIVASVPGSFTDEFYLQSCFADTHRHREWFDASTKLLALIAEISASGSLDGVRDRYKPVGSIRDKHRRRPIPEYRIGLRSYSSRVQRTEIRLRKAGQDTPWHAPHDVDAIILRWKGNTYRHVDGVRPSAEEFARLDEYLSDPLAHSIVPDWCKPKVAA